MKKHIAAAIALGVALFALLVVSVQGEECFYQKTYSCAEAIYNANGDVWIAPYPDFPAQPANIWPGIGACEECWLDADEYDFFLSPVQGVRAFMNLVYPTGGTPPTVTWGAEFAGTQTSGALETDCTGYEMIGLAAWATDAYDVTKKIQDYFKGIADRPWFYLGRVSGGYLAECQGSGGHMASVGIFTSIRHIETEWQNTFFSVRDRWPALVSSPPPGCRPDCYQLDKPALADTVGVRGATWSAVRNLYR